MQPQQFIERFCFLSVSLELRELPSFSTVKSRHQTSPYHAQIGKRSINTIFGISDSKIRFCMRRIRLKVQLCKYKTSNFLKPSRVFTRSQQACALTTFVHSSFFLSVPIDKVSQSFFYRKSRFITQDFLRLVYVGIPMFHVGWSRFGMNVF